MQYTFLLLLSYSLLFLVHLVIPASQLFASAGRKLLPPQVFILQIAPDLGRTVYLLEMRLSNKVQETVHGIPKFYLSSSATPKASLRGQKLGYLPR